MPPHLSGLNAKRLGRKSSLPAQDYWSKAPRNGSHRSPLRKRESCNADAETTPVRRQSLPGKSAGDADIVGRQRQFVHSVKHRVVQAVQCCYAVPLGGVAKFLSRDMKQCRICYTDGLHRHLTQESGEHRATVPLVERASHCYGSHSPPPAPKR